MRQILSSIYLPPALLPAGLQPRAYVPQIALPAFTFVFTFMFFSFLASVDSNDSSSHLCEPCLAAPNRATGLYLRLHVHVALLSRCSFFSKRFFQPCLAAPNRATGLYLRFHVHAILLSRLCCPTFFQPPCGSCLAAPGCAARFYLRFQVHVVLLSRVVCSTTFSLALVAGVSYPRPRCLLSPWYWFSSFSPFT